MEEQGKQNASSLLMLLASLNISLDVCQVISALIKQKVIVFPHTFKKPFC